MPKRKSTDILTKHGLVLHLIEKMNYRYVEAHNHVDAFIHTFQELLSEGNHLKLNYFGDFILQDKVARPGRNPQTGEKATITARRVLKFHPALKLKKTVQTRSVQQTSL